MGIANHRTRWMMARRIVARRMVARLVVLSVVATLVVGALPASGLSADPIGHRLLASQKRTPAGVTGQLGRLASTRNAYHEMWEHFRLRGERPRVNWQRKKVLLVTTGESSICPLRFEKLGVHHENKTFRVKAPSSGDVCTDDWTPRTFVIAVARGSIPEGKLNARVNSYRRVWVRRVR